MFLFKCCTETFQLETNSFTIYKIDTNLEIWRKMQVSAIAIEPNDIQIQIKECYEMVYM